MAVIAAVGHTTSAGPGVHEEHERLAGQVQASHGPLDGDHRGRRSRPHRGRAAVQVGTCPPATARPRAVAAFADVTGAVSTGSVAVAVAGADDEQLLVRLLEEVVYAVEVGGVVPVDVRLEERAGGLAGTLQVAPLEAVQVAGAIPKGGDLAWPAGRARRRRMVVSGDGGCVSRQLSP